MCVQNLLLADIENTQTASQAEKEACELLSGGVYIFGCMVPFKICVQKKELKNENEK